MAFKLTEELEPGDKVWSPGRGAQLVTIASVPTRARAEWQGEEAFFVSTVGVFTNEPVRWRSGNLTRWVLHIEP